MKRLFSLAAILTLGLLHAEVLYWMGDASENGIDFYFARVAVVMNGDTEKVVSYLDFADGSGPAMLGNAGDRKTGASWADISDYTDNEYGFFVEIMNYGKPNSDPFGEDRWFVAGHSGVSGYQDLVSAGHVFVDDLSIPNISAAWSPTVTIPEPSGGLLFLLGLVPLCLRRRRA